MPFVRPFANRRRLSLRADVPFPALLPLLFLSMLMVAGALTSSVQAETKQTKNVLDPATLNQQIADLSHPDYFRRNAATEQLKQTPVDQLPLLIQAIQQGDLEVKLRVLSILDHLYLQRLEIWKSLSRRIYRHPDFINNQSKKRSRFPTRAEHPLRTARLEKAGREFDQLDNLFLQLQQSQHASLAQRSQDTVHAGKVLRETRAMIAVLDFNGKVFTNPDTGLANHVLLTEEMLIDGRADITRVDVHLDETWQGGQTGLEKLKRLQNMESLYLIDGPPPNKDVLSKEERLQLQAAVPELRIQHRGRARLGIQFKGNFGDIAGARVDAVQPDTSAAKAGIKAEDVITRLNEKKIESFDALVNELANYKPGDTVEMELVRDFEKLILPVKLYGWYQ